MNEHLITDLLTAYRECPPDAERLRGIRVALGDALEESSDGRAETVKSFRVYRPEGFLKSLLNGKYFWVDGPSYIGAFRNRKEAEKAIRPRILEVFTLKGLFRLYDTAEPSRLAALRADLAREFQAAGDYRADKLSRWLVVEGEVKRGDCVMARWLAETISGSVLGYFESREQAEVAIRKYSRGIFLEMWPDDDFKWQVMANSERRQDPILQAVADQISADFPDLPVHIQDA